MCLGVALSCLYDASACRFPCLVSSASVQAKSVQSVS